MICLGKNIKGNNCNFKSLPNDEYCKLHQSYKKMILLTKENKKICKNWIRGCWNILNDEFERCLNCRLNEREKEKKLRDKKKQKAIEFNNEKTNEQMCIKCNIVVSNLKNNKCEKCYTTEFNCNKNRNDRDIFFAKLYEYKSSAKKRNINFEISDDKCFELFNLPCYYCRNKNEITGIDRVDSNLSYSSTNCVSCCSQCNFMKNDTNQDEFIKLCEHIATYNNLYDGKLYKNILKNTKFGRYSQYKKSADKRNIKFELTKEDFLNIINKKCTYCGVSDITYYKITGAGGVDRVDSNLDYTIDNCTSCCGMCNQMKLNYTKEQFLNQCVKIISNQKNIINKSKLEESIIDDFHSLQKVQKQKKKIFLHSKEYYQNRIWYGNLDDLHKIKIKLIIANNNELIDEWKYYKHTVSSLKLTENSHLVGRQIYILVSDEISKKYLGIISLSSDYLSLSERDDFIGWTKDQRIKNHKLNYILNISTCVPLQPFGFNFTGGKLLTKLIFSQEIQDIFKIKYNHNLLGITTTSLYGKSIQYDRLKEIKLIGYTKGNSVFKYPTEFIQKCKKYLEDYYNCSLNNKLYIISTILQKLELPKDEFMKSNPKGIYFGFIYPDSKDFLCDKIQNIKEDKLKSVDEIFNEWLNRWAIQRYNNLISINKIQDIVKYSSNLRVKKSIENKKKKIGEDEYKKIKNEYMKKYRDSKKILIQDDSELLLSLYPTINLSDHPTVVSTNDSDNGHASTVQSVKYTIKPDLPDNFSLYKEKDSWYLSFSKNINTIRYNKKNIMKCMCIQTELDKLINEINKLYPNLNIQNYTVINPYDFIDKKELKENNKPIFPNNFSICNVHGIDYIQFSKKINDKKVSYKKVIKSYDLQKELDNFVNYLNQEYSLNLDEKKIIELNNWKSSNKIK